MRSALLLIIVLLAFDANARGRAPVRQFYKMMACPSTMEIAPPCPGYVVDHVISLCLYGKDIPENMQWQKYQESLLKDRAEVAFCRWLRKAGK